MPNLMSVLKVVPKNTLSNLVGRVVQTKLPGSLGKASVQWFADRYRIDLKEAEFPVDHYKSIGELFTRRLKPGLRPIEGDIVHPADSKIAACGPIENEALVQAKGIEYTLTEFLQDTEAAKEFQDGWFVTYYLCPTDYHRVHSPITGKIQKVTHIPGALWPVNDWGLNNIKGLFAVNERVVIRMSTAVGPVAVVMVGATNVGKITLNFDPAVATNTGPEGLRKNYDPPVEIKVGEELGVFHMGSTVIVLYPKTAFNQRPEPKGAVRVGQKL